MVGDVVGGSDLFHVILYGFHDSVAREPGDVPVTSDEIAKLIPTDGRKPVEEIYAEASATYGADRVSEQSFLNTLQRCIAEARFGYAATETSIIQTGPQAVTLGGYVGRPEALPADARIVRFSGLVSPVELANVMKAAINLSRLGESSLTVDLRLELKGEVSDHSVATALNELRSHVASLSVEDNKPS